MKRLLLIGLLLLQIAPIRAQQNSDTELLGRALEYFASNKYHEALNILQRLDKQYKLNDRFKAYIGLCYYYEWEYKLATKYFDEVADKLDNLSPHERSVYYYAAAESYFQLEEYDKSLNYFQKDLQLCYNNEKGDIYYRIGLCHMFKERWQDAIIAYKQADHYLSALRNPEEIKAKRAQIQNMQKGCQQKLNALYISNCKEQNFPDKSPLYVDALKQLLSAYLHLQTSAAINPLPSE